MKFNINKDLFPFQNNFLHLDDGTKIHYIDEGEGPVLLNFRIVTVYVN